MRLMTLLMAFELTACASVERPNSDVCLVNAGKGYRKCYNLARDYDEDGKLKRDAKATYRPNTKIEDINKAVCIDSDTGFVDGWARFKAYQDALRREAKSRRGD